MEQYEIDVMKALFYYRPSGKQHKSSERYIEADIDVVTEIPNSKGQFSKPALWSWIKKPAENAIERRKIFTNVFDIDCYPENFGALNSSAIRAYYQNVYEKRNALAHGRSSIEVTLSEYCKAEAFALNLFLHLSNVCYERYALGV